MGVQFFLGCPILSFGNGAGESHRLSNRVVAMAGKLTQQCGNGEQVPQLNGLVFRLSNWRSGGGKQN